MRLKLCILPILGWFFLNGTAPGFSQVNAAARVSHLPLTIGAGISNYDSDWGKSRIDGSGLWIDYYPERMPRILSGLGAEVEAHDLSWGRGSDLPSNFRQDTAGGGAIYSWHHFRNARPYAKGLIEFGSFDWGPCSFCRNYVHDTRTVYAMGAGLDYHVFGHIWARGDYEFQNWQNLPALGTGDPTPNGFTFGAMYDFRPAHSER